MAKIRNAKPKSSSGGYFRLTGNKQVADLLTKAQSTVITNGTELEKMIAKRANCITNLDEFMLNVNSGIITEGTYLCTKKVAKKSSYSLYKKEPDFLIFILTKTGKTCLIIELKDGDAFDTKKSSSEYESLVLYKNHIGSLIEFKTNYKICAFNQLSKEKIKQGFKNEFTEDQIMTGKEFCDILSIDYEEIVNKRKEDAEDNFEYFIQEMTSIINTLENKKTD
ncbi:MAG: restriction endonuclease [Firmicutes bacterium]|nr:restriction endonuclease [Bacillota bacterium]